jgi:hypothetical protein
VFLGIASHLQVMTLILILNFLFHSPLLPCWMLSYHIFNYDD